MGANTRVTWVVNRGAFVNRTRNIHSNVYKWGVGRLCNQSEHDVCSGEHVCLMVSARHHEANLCTSEKNAKSVNGSLRCDTF